MLLIGGDATRGAGLTAGARIAEATGTRWYCETFPTRLERGAGVPAVDRIPYFAEAVVAQLEGTQHLILAGAPSPVSFFAYPDKPSDLVPEGCSVHVLAGPTGAAAALAALADEVAPGTTATVAELSRPQLPTGALTAVSVADVVGALMPENAIVVDESNTSSVPLTAATAGAPAHDWLTLTGGAIGYGIPAAVGAAVAAPDRPVLCLESDGSAMYTISGLWTQARENLDVTTVIYNNGAYDILRLELQRVGAGSTPGPKALDLLDISRPTMDFVKIAEGMGVPARRATTAEEFADALRAAFAEPGPHLIDAVVPVTARLRAGGRQPSRPALLTTSTPASYSPSRTSAASATPTVPACRRDDPELADQIVVAEPGPQPPFAAKPLAAKPQRCSIARARHADRRQATHRQSAQARPRTGLGRPATIVSARTACNPARSRRDSTMVAGSPASRITSCTCCAASTGSPS